MILSDCPNCSGFHQEHQIWFVRRPKLSRGKRTGRVFISGCCGFSSAVGPEPFYESEEAAAAAWEQHRAAAAVQCSRMAAMVAELDRRSLLMFGPAPAKPVAVVASLVAGVPPMPRPPANEQRMLL